MRIFLTEEKNVVYLILLKEKFNGKI